MATNRTAQIAAWMRSAMSRRRGATPIGMAESNGASRPDDSHFIQIVSAESGSAFPRSILDNFYGSNNPHDFNRDITATKSNAVAHGFVFLQNRALYDLYDEMVHKDPTISRALRLIVRFVMRRDAGFQVTDEEDPRAPDIRDFCEAELTKTASMFGWHQFIEAGLRGALQHGFSVTEIVLDEERFLGDGAIVPKAYMHRHPGQFVFDQMGTLFRASATGQREELPQDKFAVIRIPALYSNVFGESAIHDLMALYWFKKQIFKSWLFFAETYGQPLVIVRPHEGTDLRGEHAHIKTKLENIIKNLARSLGLVLSGGEQIEFHDRTGGTRSDLHEKIVRWCCAEQVKHLLGAVLGTDEAEFGTRAQAEVHGHTTDISVAPLADLVSESINRDVVNPFVGWNFGPDAPRPRFKISTDDPINIEAFVQSVEKAVDFEVDVAKAQYREVTGLRVPKDDEEVLAKPASEPQGPPLDFNENDDGKKNSKRRSERLSRSESNSDSQLRSDGHLKRRRKRRAKSYDLASDPFPEDSQRVKPVTNR